MVNIAERPAGAAGRAVPGHWEGDIIFGTRRSTIATLVERHSRFVLLVALPRGHGAGGGRRARSARPSPRCRPRLRRSLTWDQGKEMAEHARFSVATGVPVYFSTRTRPGSAAATRTPTGCCASTSPAAPTSRR